MTRITLLTAAFALSLTVTATGQTTTDPSVLMDDLLRGAAQQNAARQRNEMMRLEIQRRELEAQLRYRRMTDRQVSDEFRRYCPKGEPPCRRQPPDALLQEAARRGLIEFSGSVQQPRAGCFGMADPGGAISLDCY